MKVDERIKERQNIINEFEKLVKDLSEVGIHIKKRPNDYNEPHYLIYESEAVSYTHLTLPTTPYV